MGLITENPEGKVAPRCMLGGNVGRFVTENPKGKVAPRCLLGGNVGQFDNREPRRQSASVGHFKPESGR